ncbi:hypothetical protein [Actinophytocola sediminis]
MAEESFPFDDLDSSETDWWQMARLWAPDGVVLEDAGPITLGSGLTFVVPDGFAGWIRGHYYRNDGSLPLTATDNVNSNPRRDQLVLRLDRSSDSIVAAILEGTPAVSPSPPTPTQDDDTVWEIPIAYAWVPGNPTAQNYSGLTPNNSWTGAVPHMGLAVPVEYGGVSTPGSVATSAYTPNRSAGSPVRGAFVAAPSGMARVSFRARVRNDLNSSSTMLVAFIIRHGATPGSGTTFQDADDNVSIQHTGLTDLSAGNVDLVSGLTPGASYNVELVYKRTTGGNMVVTAPWVMVEPVGA